LLLLLIVICSPLSSSQGHLFDSGLINNILDELESFPEIKFSLANLDGLSLPPSPPLPPHTSPSSVRPNVSGHSVPSHVQFQITGPQERVKYVSDHIAALAEKNKSADAQISFDTAASKATGSTTLRVESPRRVLLLGSGRVCAPVVKMLGGHDNVFITIASDVESQARDLMSLVHPSKCSYEAIRFPQDDYKLGRLVASTDVVISLLPATMHYKVTFPLLSVSSSLHRFSVWI
jgi:hypothetical protein